MSDPDPSRSLFLFSAAVLGAAGCFLLGIVSAETENGAYRTVAEARNAVRLAGQPNGLARLSTGYVHEHLQPARAAGSGVTINAKPDDGAQVLLVGFFDGENQARLVARDGSVERTWSFDYFDHFPDPKNRACDHTDPLAVDMHGAMLTDDGGIIANYEYCGTVKLDQCGTLDWALKHNSHHSVTPAYAAGGYWILGRRTWRSDEPAYDFPPFTGDPSRSIEEDLLLRVSEDGEIVEMLSLPRIFNDGGLGPLLGSWADGEDGLVRSEILHANKIAELPPDRAAAFPGFEAGDLALSMRSLNLIVVLDGRTKAVKWHQTGPWVRQHDPEWREDGRLSIFNNNLYQAGYDDFGHVAETTEPRTDIMAVDPETGETEEIFGDGALLSVIRGQHELLDDGGILIAEFDGGRVLEVDASGEIVWEYVNRYDETYVGEISNALLYPVPPGEATCP